MLFLNSTEYAIRELSEVAIREEDKPVMLDEFVHGTEPPRGWGLTPEHMRDHS
jgi:hypothetical protein